MADRPVNQVHRTLRLLSEEDPSLALAVAWADSLIDRFGYEPVFLDPGMRAWVGENRVKLKKMADDIRLARANKV
jgi:hypothetical protein